jgi:hypothetical protein
MKIAVIGGTGKEGRGLVLRLAAAGEDDTVLIGSRSLEKAETSAAEFNQKVGRRNIIGLDNRAAARDAELVILCVPYAAHEKTLSEIASELSGKVLIDATVPLDTEDPMRLKRRSDLSAAEEAQAALGASVKVVAAFQNISATALKNPTAPLDCDILVCGDDKQAKATVIEIINRLGMRALDAGPLGLTRVVEELTPLLISINIRYKSKWAGIRITGVEGA